MNTEELRLFDGEAGRPAYIAYEGKVYDVSHCHQLLKGTHVDHQIAGNDLTGKMHLAPHGDGILTPLKVICAFDDSPAPLLKPYGKPRLRSLYRRFHLHPPSTHIPQGLYFFAALMQIVYLLGGNESFAQSAYYSLVVATLSVVPAMATGCYSWWINYDLTITPIFRGKLIFSSALLVTGIAAVAIRYQTPGMAGRGDALEAVYTALVLLCVALAYRVAWLGGKITWPR